MFQTLRLTVSPKAAQVALGGHLTLALTVHNASRGDARYRVDVSGIPADWYDLDQPRISLRPAASALANLSVHPPGGTVVAAAGRYTLTVQVRAEEDPAIRASTVVALMVTTGGGLDMDVQPAQAVGRQGVFRITFLNQMTWPVYVELTAHDPEDGLRFRIEPGNAVVVPAGGVAGPVTVHVEPRVRALLGAPHPYEIQFHSLELGSRRRTTRQARFVYVPRYPAPHLPVWLRMAPGRAVLLPLVLLVLLVLLLIVAGSRTLARRATTPPPAPTRAASSVQPARPRATVPGVPLSRPSIRRFTLVHRHQGQPYELVWQVSGAAHATLDGRPVSARGSLALQVPLHSAIYRLAATNGARRATARLHLVVDAVTTDRHAFVLTTPDIATFAVRRGSKGKLYALWLVRDAVHVWLQGRFVAGAGEGLVPPGASRLRLVARNDVGSRQMLLHLASLMPTATPRPRPTATPTLRPTATPTLRPTMTATARPSRLLIAHPTATPRPTATRKPRPTATRTPRPRATPTPRPTRTSTPRPTETPTARPTVMSTPRPIETPTPRSTETPTARPTATRTPRPTAAPRPTATRTPRPRATPTPRPTRTPTPHPTPTPTPMFVALGTPPPIATVLSTPAAVPTARPTRTPTPVSVTIGSATPQATPTPPVAMATPTAVSVTCCPAQP